MNNFTPTAHSSVVGGSTAAKRLACPASYQMEQKVPASVQQESSAYADEGTALHDAMAYMLMNDVFDASEIVGMVLDANVHSPVTITAAHARDCLQPALNEFDTIVGENQGEVDFLVEKRCIFPGIPDAFGTSDLIAGGVGRTYIIDWKFGAGVPVYASVDNVPNAQLMYYAMAALHTHPNMFGLGLEWPVELIIVQPRSRDEENRITRCEVRIGDLFAFRDQLVRAVVEAQSEAPSRAKGGHCRFAACKVICPEHTGPLLDLAHWTGGELVKAKADPDVDWGGLYSTLLTLADAVDPLLKEIASQAHAYMERGAAVPGYKLVPKRAAARAWKDEKRAEQYLARQGVALEDRRVVATVTPAVAEKLLKKLGKALKDVYVEPGVSSGTKIARADDARTEVPPLATSMRLLGDLLDSLQLPGKVETETENRTIEHEQ